MVRGIQGSGTTRRKKRGTNMGGRRHTYGGKGADIQGKESIRNGNYTEKGVKTQMESRHTWRGDIHGEGTKAHALG